MSPVTPPYDEATAAALEALGPPIMLFRMFARRPERARAIQSWGSYYLSRRSALTLRQRELVIDRTTARCGAEYEWAIHIDVFAAKAGLTDAQVRSLAQGDAGDACWDAAEDRAVLHAVDALHAKSDLTDEQWDDLVAATGEDGALEVILLCGWYHAISFAVRALRLPLEPGTVGFPPMTSATPLTFRTAGPADVPALVDLIDSAFRGERSRIGWTSEADLLSGQRVDAQMLGEAVSNPDGLVLVVEADGEMVACCEMRRGDGYAHFGMFSVSPSRQGGGLGRAVLAEAERFARTEWGAGELRMTVIVQREDLIAWYVRRGYTRTGQLSPFPYGDERFGVPLRPDLAFETLTKRLG